MIYVTCPNVDLDVTQCKVTAIDPENVCVNLDSTGKNATSAYRCPAANTAIATLVSSAFATKDGMGYSVRNQYVGKTVILPEDTVTDLENVSVD